MDQGKEWVIEKAGNKRSYDWQVDAIINRMTKWNSGITIYSYSIFIWVINCNICLIFQCLYCFCHMRLDALRSWLRQSDSLWTDVTLKTMTIRWGNKKQGDSTRLRLSRLPEILLQTNRHKSIILVLVEGYTSEKLPSFKSPKLDWSIHNQKFVIRNSSSSSSNS